MGALSLTHKRCIAAHYKPAMSIKLACNNQSLLLQQGGQECDGKGKHTDTGIDPLSLFQLGFILISLENPYLILPCPTQQRWPRCQLCFRAEMCFKSCCRMVMCGATCQLMSILRQMGEAVVKKHGSFELEPGSNLPHKGMA